MSLVLTLNALYYQGSSRHVRLYLSASGEDQSSERRFLAQFVLPGQSAIRVCAEFKSNTRNCFPGTQCTGAVLSCIMFRGVSASHKLQVLST